MSDPGGGDLSDDAVLGGRLLLRQPRAGHRAGTDAILLAATVPAGPGDVVADFGAGVGSAGLAVLRRIADTRAVLVEIDPGYAALAGENALRNDLSERATVISADVAVFGLSGAPLGPESVDHVLSNPPYNPPGSRPPPDERTARARVAPEGLLEDWCRAATRVLRPGGTFSLVHRPDALAEILAATSGRFGALAVRFVHPRADRPAVRVLVQGVKGSRAPVTVLPPFVLHGEDGAFTGASEAVHRHMAALGMKPG